MTWQVSLVRKNLRCHNPRSIYRNAEGNARFRKVRIQNIITVFLAVDPTRNELVGDFARAIP